MKKIFLFLFIFLFILSGCVGKKQEPDHKENNDEITPKQYKVSLVAVGDNLIHETIYQAAKTETSYNFYSMFEEVQPYIQQFDLKFINQETILGGTEIGLSTYPCFNSPQELGDNLIDMGFNLFSIANNHTLDRGERGVLNAIEYLDRKNVIYAGATKTKEESPIKIFEINQIKFAFVAYTYGTNGIPHPKEKIHLVHVYSPEKAKEELEKVKDMVDVIIVSMHWGEEYQLYPNQFQKEQANYLSSLGVHIIIGHHPHVIQPIEMIKYKDHETLVIYSLGNFLSDQKGIDRLIGMAVSVDIYKKEEEKIKISFDQITAKLLYCYKDRKENTFLIKWYENLDEYHLKDHHTYFDQKSKLITTYQKKIKIT